MKIFLAVLVLMLAGCPRHVAAKEPVAEPAPVELQWPDGGVADAGE